MNEIALKYGCNPNQKPACIRMADGSDLPVTVLNGRPGPCRVLGVAGQPRSCPPYIV